MLHQLLLASYSQPEAAGFILRGIKEIFVVIGSVIAAIVCALVAATKGRNPFGWGILGLFFSILTLIVVVPDTVQEVAQLAAPSNVHTSVLSGSCWSCQPPNVLIK